MAGTIRQATGSLSPALGGGSTASLKLTLENTLAGSGLLVVFQVSAQAEILTSVTDDQSALNVYTVLPALSAPGGLYDIYFAYALNTLGGTEPTITGHFSGTTTNVYAIVAEMTGVNTFRGTDAGNTGTSTTPVSASVATQAGDFLLGYFGTSGFGLGTQTAGNGYSSAGLGLSPSVQGFIFLEDGTSAGGSQTAGCTMSGGPSWAAGIAAFYQTAAVSGGNNGAGLLRLLGVN